jgi:LuxR family quorum-sensing transcriptional regulator LasR
LVARGLKSRDIKTSWHQDRTANSPVSNVVRKVGDSKKATAVAIARQLCPGSRLNSCGNRPLNWSWMFRIDATKSRMAKREITSLYKQGGTVLANIKPGKPSVLRGAALLPTIGLLIDASRNNKPLEPIMSRAMRDMGFDSFMYGMSNTTSPLRKEGRSFVWTTLPSIWVRRYAEMGYIEVDPRATETFNRNVPLIWDAEDYRDDTRCEAFFRDAARFGVCSGVVVSFSDPDHGRVVVAFNSSLTPVGLERRRMLEAHVGEFMLFATSFHDFFMANLVDTDYALMARVQPLSVRVRQCLELAARGMTSDDIGEKLGITGRTANFHVSNIIRKTGVLNRKEAIAVAIARGWIHLDSATLRSGYVPVRRPRK